MRLLPPIAQERAYVAAVGVRAGPARCPTTKVDLNAIPSGLLSLPIFCRLWGPVVRQNSVKIAVRTDSDELGEAPLPPP